MDRKVTIFKRIYIPVLSVITGLVCIFGTAKNVKGFLNNFNVGNFSIGNINFGNSGSGEHTHTDVERFDAIELDASIADVEIKEGSGYALDYAIDERLDLNYTIEEGVLKINMNGSSGISFGSGIDCELMITVPEGVGLSTLSIKTDAGNVEIHDISIENISVAADAGNIEITNVSAKTFAASADAGNVEITDSTIDIFAASADAGAIEMNNTVSQKISVAADMGSIDIEASFDEIEANCSMGSIHVTTDTAEGKVIKLTTDLGEVVFNGQSMGTKYIR